MYVTHFKEEKEMMKKIISMLLAVTMIAGLTVGCGKSNSTSGTETSKNNDGKTTNLVMYLYGSAGAKNQDILDKLNEKLKASTNATLQIKYIDWNDVATKYPLLWASGEDFDMAYASSTASVPYATLAKQGALVDITDLLDKDAKTLKSSIGDNYWKSMEVNGKIYGVPSTYSEYTAYGFVTRSDLLKKYGMTDVKSIADMEKYMDAAVADKQVPLNGSSNLAMDLYRMFVATTSDWIDAPGIPNSEMYLTSSLKDTSKVVHPAFTDEFEAFAVKMHDWAQKGYWSKDVLSSTQDDKDSFYNGLSAAYISHQPDWTGSYGNQLKKLPGIDTEFYTFAEAGNKIERKMGVENATAISKNSKHADLCLKVIEQLMTDKDCYDLFQYGILGQQYELKDGKITQPANFNADKDGGGFAGWALRTDKLNIPQATEDPRRYTMNEAWSKTAIDNPYAGFSFDSTSVSSQLSAISNVDSQLGIQIMLGLTSQDPKEAVAQYRKQLEAAGVNDVIKAVNDQLKDYKPAK